MSTFKVQPVYAELIMGWLELAWVGGAGVTMDSVLERVSWCFKGGQLGEYPQRYPSACSGTYYPQGATPELKGERDLSALWNLIGNRVADKRVRIRGCADWAASYALMSAVWKEAGARQQVLTGLGAVYVMLRDVWASCEDTRRGGSLRKLGVYIREMVLASSSGSFLDLPTAAERVASVLSALSHTRLGALRSAAAEFMTLFRYSGSGGARQQAVQRGRALLGGEMPPGSPQDAGASQFIVAGRKYWVSHGCAFAVIGGRPLALSRSDLTRIHQFLTGVQSGLLATVTQACVAPGPERCRAVEIGRAYERQVSRILEGSRAVPQGDEVSLCKAFKRAFGAFLGELSGPLCARETADLWREARATPHAAGMDLDGWVGEIRAWSAGTAFNLGKVYKLCPAPDACPGLTMLERHEMVTNHNDFDPATSEEFEAELRAQILRAHIRAPGVRLDLRGAAPSWWGAYRAGRLDEVPSREIHTYLAWEGTAVMPQRSPDNPAMWKDSGLGWDSYELALSPDRPRMSGNMLTRMVFDPTAPLPGVRHFGHAHDHKVDIKPEGHKDPARAIFSGNIRDRLNQSWMEAAVEAVAVHHPAFMIGADVEARDARVREIVERPHDPELIVVYYSFDVSGWSPRMSPIPQAISHTLWGQLFDEDLFRAADQIMNGARVYMNKGGYQGWFINPGSNFEGYDGKQMTMILITLMALAVGDWRQDVVQAGLATEAEAATWAAILLAYIDDGLTRMVLPRTRATALFERFKGACERRFRRSGYTIEASKCYPSDRFAIFLNEPYLGGRHVVHGTRAAMTICAENTEEHTSLIERLTAVSTGCRGAVMAGLDATAGVILQAYHAYQHLQEWVRGADPVALAVWSVAPRAWGGLGLPTALQLGTSGSGSAFEESARVLQAWANISTPARLIFLRRARGRLETRTATGVLMAPLGGRCRDGTMVESRVPDAVRAALARLQRLRRVSPIAADFLGYAAPESLDGYAEAIVTNGTTGVLQEQLLCDLASAHPHAIFSAFASRIEKSSTLMQIVGKREVSRIIRENRKDATSSYAALRALLLV